MFEDALLDSSAQNQATLRRAHYLISALACGTAFALGHYLLPFIFLMPGVHALMSASAVGAVAIGFFTLTVCYVGVDARRQHLHAGVWVAVTMLLNLPGFLIYLIWSARKSGDWRRAAMPLAYVAESLVAGALVVVPMIHMQALPTQLTIASVPIAPPQGQPDVPNTGRHGGAVSLHPTINPFHEPPRVPDKISLISDPTPRVAEGPYSPDIRDALAGPGREGWGIPDGAPWNKSTPPPPAPTHRVAPKPTTIRLSGPVVAAKAIYQPKPVYPHLALISRTQGTVVLQAIIGSDGSIRDLKVLSGSPLLVMAALDAVKTWRYQPTLLNSEPVEVLTEIDVNFRLDE